MFRIHKPGKSKKQQYNPSGCASCGTHYSYRWYTVPSVLVEVGRASVGLNLSQCSGCQHEGQAPRPVVQTVALAA